MKRFIIFFLILSPLLFSQEKYEIEVQGKKVPFSFDLKRDVLIIEKDFLKQFPSLNLAQLISFVANMNFICRGIFQADPQIMGFNQEQVVVMVNGIPFNNPQTGHHNFLLPFGVEQIERIEILRGGFTSLYGLSGTGGIINIITSSQNSFKISRSSFNTTSSSLNLGFKNFYISSGIVSTDGYMEGIDGKKYYLQGGLKFSMRKNYFEIWSGWILSKFGAYNFYAPYPSFEKLDRFLGLIRWNSQLSSNIIFTFKFSSQYSKDEFKLFRDNPDFYLNNHKTLQNSIEMGIKRLLKAGAYYFGISSYLDSINSNGIRKGEQAIALGDHNRTLYSFFGEISGERKNIFINSGVRLTVGTYSNFSSHFLLGYWFKKRLKISNSLYRSFRIPTYTELYYSDPAHLSTPGLKPETSWGYSFSIDYKMKNTEGGVRFFINQSENLIDWKKNQEQSIWVSENLKRGEYYGLDLSFSYKSKQTKLKILYTFQKARFKDNPLIKSLKYHYYFPDSSLSLMLYEDFKLFSVYGALKVESEEYTGKNRFYLNLKASKRIRKINLFAEVLNLFNNRVEKIPGLPESPRSYSAGLNFSF
ncbi:MAG: TonB-dependent receptor plug domain-containing protein [Candidatus Aminicenantales bacterium]